MNSEHYRLRCPHCEKGLIHVQIVATQTHVPHFCMEHQALTAVLEDPAELETGDFTPDKFMCSRCGDEWDDLEHLEKSLIAAGFNQLRSF